jgi:hypothetical protein
MPPLSGIPVTAAQAHGGVPQIAVAGQAAAHGGVKPVHVQLRRPVITGREGVVAGSALRGRGTAEGHRGVVVEARCAGDGGAGARRAGRPGRGVGRRQAEHRDGCSRGQGQGEVFHCRSFLCLCPCPDWLALISTTAIEQGASLLFRQACRVPFCTTQSP